MNLDGLITYRDDGEALISTEAVSLLIDVPADDIRAEMRRQGTAVGADDGKVFTGALPKQWIARGQRICARLQVQYGITDMASAIAILATERNLNIPGGAA